MKFITKKDIIDERGELLKKGSMFVSTGVKAKNGKIIYMSVDHKNIIWTSRYDLMNKDTELYKKVKK